MLKRFMCIFFLALLLDKVLSSYIYVSDSEEDFMSNAFLNCRKSDGILLTNDEVDEYAEEIKAQCPEVKGIYWIGNYSTITPMLSLEGCYEYENFSTGSAFFISTDNSVAKCQARCSTEAGIAIKGDVCQCFTQNQFAKFIQARVEDCDIKKNGEIRGGSDNTMSVYIKQGEGDGVKPGCLFGRCIGRSVAGPCETRDKSRTVCASEVLKEFEDTDDWWNATQMCISNNSYLVSADKFADNKDSLCLNNEALRIWTNRRQYMDTIIIPGDGIRENYIHNENVVCQRVNMTDLTFVQTRQCNGNQKHGYLCKTNVRPNVSNSCVVNLTQGQTDQTTHSTREVLTTLSTGILSTSTSESSLLANTTITRGPEDKTDTKSPADSTSVIIIGAAVGGGVVVLLGVGLVLFAVKRNSKKTNNGSVKFSELKKAEENGTQSLKGIDNQVFMTPGQANTVGERYETAYDLAGDGEPKFDKSDTEYDMLRQNKKPGNDSTYDHTTNTYGMTSHVTNDEVVYDSGDPSIYDRSRSNKKSMRGDDVYDKMESNIYDKTNTNGSDKSGDNIYDRGNDHVYDGTSVAKRGEIGDNIYDKTNDNVYDGTSVAKRCETGDNIYDKTNENLYDKSSTSRSDQAGDNVYDKTNENIYD